MPRDIEIAPAILAADHGRLAEAVERAQQAGADLIHIDIMDGRFAPEISFGIAVVRDLRSVTRLPLDVHLMVEHPERFVPALARAGANVVTVHAEACRHLHRVVQEIRDSGLQVGVAVNPATSLNVLEEILPEIDLALVMTVDPGYSGLIEAMLSKITRLRRLLDEAALSRVPVVADGGLTLGNVRRVVAAGARRLVAASAVFRHEKGIDAAIAELRNAARLIWAGAQDEALGAGANET